MTETLWGRRATVRLEVSSAAPDATPVWVDLTSYLLSVGGRGQPVRASAGRQTELAGDEPGRLTFTLNNNDHRFTPGNPSSPYVTWWKQRRRCRLRETVGAKTFDLLDGFLQIPQVVIQTEGIDQTVTVSAIDRRGHLQQGRTFVSTLAEHIRYHGGENLIGYYPLNDAAAPLMEATGRGILPARLLEVDEGPEQIGTPNEESDLLTYRGGQRIPGDDVTCLLYAPVFGTTAASDIYVHHTRYHQASTASTWSVASGEILTLALWVITSQTTEEFWRPVVIYSDTASLAIIKNPTGGTPSNTWVGEADGSGAAALNCDSDHPVAVDVAHLIAVQIDWEADTAELWVHDKTPVSGTLFNTFSGLAFDTIRVGQYAPATLAHVQVYRGASTAYTREMHLAQIEAGMTGLERQTTGERIRTILGYAGVAAAGLDQIDDGTTVMPRATLAGQTPDRPLAEAVTTEQGRLHVDGRGQFVFHDRRRRYNV